MIRIVTACAAAAALLAAPASEANIVVGKSIDGVALGDSMATVKRKLGRPNQKGGAQPVVWSYSGRKLSVYFNRRKVSQLVTFNSRERTSKGVGPGSTIAAVGRAYPDACVNPFHCAIAIGRTSTQFDSGTGPRGRVQTVKVEKLLALNEV